MNTESDTRQPHLDLDDLIAGAAGRPVDDQAGDHLAGCTYCQLEARRWSQVADGIHALVADPQVTRPTQPLRASQHSPWRRAVLAVGSAAAALVLFLGVGIAIGDVHVRLSGSGHGPVLTAVAGCSELEEAHGVLQQVNGTRLVIQTAGGQPVTVTVTASTFISMTGPLLGSITDGASVQVRGHASDGAIQAAFVTVGQPFGAVNPPGLVPLQGTVSDADSSGFTLVASTGTRVRVTTSRGTLVVIPHASPSQLQTGSPIFAIGTLGSDGTLSATGVAAVSQLPTGHIKTSVKVKNCSPTSIIEALGTLSPASPNN